jgi:hypothetical protein
VTSPNLADHFTQLQGALSTLQQTVNNVAAMQAAILTQLSQPKPTRRFSLRRKPKTTLGVVDPNAGASAQSVADDLAGTDGNGSMLPWRKVAMFYEANIFGRSKDYAFTEGANVSASLLDHGASLAKLQTRCKTLADGNQYDEWDAIMTVAKWVVANNLTINDDSPHTVNHKD